MLKHSATCFETIITWPGCGLANCSLTVGAIIEKTKDAGERMKGSLLR